MSASSFPAVRIDPNDPRLHTPERQRLPGEYDSPQARRLYELELRDKAERTENCTKLGRVGTCPNGHKVRQISLCGLRFCPLCAPNLADKLFRQWQEILRLMESAENSRFWFVEVKAPLERDTDRMEDFRNRYYDQLAEKCILGDCGGIGPMWDFFASYADGRLDFRSLVTGPNLTPAEWCAIFPGAEVRVHHVPMYRLSHFFKEMLEVTLPTDPVERADLEKLFEGMHRLRAKHVYGIGSENAEDFSVGGSDSTEKSRSDIEPEPAQGVKKATAPAHRCPICKMAVRVFGPWRSMADVNAEMAGFADHAPPN